MILDFDAAEMQRPGWLSVHVKNAPYAMQFLLNMKIGKTYTCDIKEYRAKRSLDANAYAWALMDKLASKVNLPKDTVYRRAVKNIGGNNETVCVPNPAVNRLISGWQHNGLGWVCETMPSKINGCTNVVLYYGSSSYDSAQMARLIDNIVQDCNAVGIETKTPKELSLLVDEWEKKNGQKRV